MRVEVAELLRGFYGPQKRERRNQRVQVDLHDPFSRIIMLDPVDRCRWGRIRFRFDSGELGSTEAGSQDPKSFVVRHLLGCHSILL
jgi:hypothetical protein